MAKKFNSFSALVYSTDPNFKPEEEPKSSATTLSPEKQYLKIWLDKKHRGGKAVTLIDGFEGSEEDLKDLGKKLKTFCGTGGSVKDGQIIVQGDNRDKIIIWLQKQGFTKCKKI